MDFVQQVIDAEPGLETLAELVTKTKIKVVV